MRCSFQLLALLAVVGSLSRLAVCADVEPPPHTVFDVPISLDGGEPVDAADFLESLRRRDAQFDNLTLTVEKTWSETVNPRAFLLENALADWKFGGAVGAFDPNQVKIGEDVPEPYRQPHRVRYEMTIRGPAVTLNGGQELEQILDSRYSALPSPGLRWGNEGGIERCYDESGEPNDEGTLRIRRRSSSDSALEMWRDSIQFACGFGFARRIYLADRCVSLGDTRVFQGRARFGENDDQHCLLEFDSNWVVRRAEFLQRSPNGGESRIRVATAGMLHPQGVPPCAAVGTFHRTTMGPLQPDRPPPFHVTSEHSTFRFVEVKAHLTDAEYQEIAQIEPTAGTLVVDDAEPRLTPTIRPPGDGSRSRFSMLLMINAVVLLAVASMFYVNRRRANPPSYVQGEPQHGP